MQHVRQLSPAANMRPYWFWAAMCQEATSNHLIRSPRRRDRAAQAVPSNAKCLGGPEIDHELKHRRLLNWEIGWFLTPQDARNQQTNLRKGITGLGPKLVKPPMSGELRPLNKPRGQP
jgi:hypothetical protein